MKKLIAMILACLMLVCCTACSDGDDWIERGDGVNTPAPEEGDKNQDSAQDEIKPDEPAEDKKQSLQTKQEIQALAAEALEKLNKLPEYQSETPVLEDVIKQYEKANEAIGWIINTQKIATNPDDTHTSHGLEYQRVLADCHYGDEAGKSEDNEKLIYNRETLKAYLATLIHPEEANDYMIDLKEGYEVPRITAASNGALYALPFFYTPEGYGKDDEYELIDNGDGSYTFAVTYTTLNEDGSEDGRYTQKFGYKKVDGRWVFTNFRVIKQ